MDFTRLGRGAAMGTWEGIGPPAEEPGPANQNEFFPPKRALITDKKIHLSFISCLGGWSQAIPQMKKPGVEVLGWRG
jgi:hypothetical protein